MAGNYPDVPSWRMAYDRDGTQFFRLLNGVVTQLTSGEVSAMNDEDPDAAPVTSNEVPNGSLIAIFPEVRDLDGFYCVAWTLARDRNASITVYVSADTTNGVDGTWTQLIASYASPYSSSIVPGYRTAIKSVTALAIKGVKVSLTGGWACNIDAMHLYGEPVPGANPDRLEIWHPTNDERVTPAYFDWGNVPRGSSADKLFRVKNISPSLTAESIRVAMEIATDGTPSVPGQHTLSVGGGSFLSQVNVGDLAPGAISQPVTLRRVTASDAQLGVFAFRVFAEAQVWA